MSQSTNIHWQDALVDNDHRRWQKRHRCGVLWFEGLSGSGKSTLAHALEEKLYELGVHTYVLDGDNVRHGLCGDLGFSEEDRKENLRRIAESAKLMADAGLLVMAAFITPFESSRKQIRSIISPFNLVEIYVEASLETCEERDVKGLYKKARAGHIQGFTGIDAPFEMPMRPSVTVSTDKHSLEENVDQIIHYLKKENYIEIPYVDAGNL